MERGVAQNVLINLPAFLRNLPATSIGPGISVSARPEHNGQDHKKNTASKKRGHQGLATKMRWVRLLESLICSDWKRIVRTIKFLLRCWCTPSVVHLTTPSPLFDGPERFPIVVTHVAIIRLKSCRRASGWPTTSVILHATIFFLRIRPPSYPICKARRTIKQLRSCCAPKRMVSATPHLLRRCPAYLPAPTT